MVEDVDRAKEAIDCCSGANAESAVTANNFLDDIRESMKSANSQVSDSNNASTVKEQINALKDKSQLDKNDSLAIKDIFSQLNDKNAPKDIREHLKQLRDQLPGSREKLLEKPEEIAAEIAKNGLTPKAVESIKAQMGDPRFRVEGKKDVIEEVNKELAKTNPNLKLELQRHAIIPEGPRIGNDVQVSVALKDGKEQKGNSAPLYKYWMNY